MSKSDTVVITSNETWKPTEVLERRAKLAAVIAARHYPIGLRGTAKLAEHSLDKE